MSFQNHRNYFGGVNQQPYQIHIKTQDVDNPELDFTLNGYQTLSDLENLIQSNYDFEIGSYFLIDENERIINNNPELYGGLNTTIQHLFNTSPTQNRILTLYLVKTQYNRKKAELPLMPGLIRSGQTESKKSKRRRYTHMTPNIEAKREWNHNLHHIYNDYDEVMNSNPYNEDEEEEDPPPNNLFGGAQGIDCRIKLHSADSSINNKELLINCNSSISFLEAYIARNLELPIGSYLLIDTNDNIINNNEDYILNTTTISSLGLRPDQNGFLNIVVVKTIYNRSSAAGPMPAFRSNRTLERKRQDYNNPEVKKSFYAKREWELNHQNIPQDFDHVLANTNSESSHEEPQYRSVSSMYGGSHPLRPSLKTIPTLNVQSQYSSQDTSLDSSLSPPPLRRYVAYDGKDNSTSTDSSDSDSIFSTDNYPPNPNIYSSGISNLLQPPLKHTGFKSLSTEDDDSQGLSDLTYQEPSFTTTESQDISPDEMPRIPRSNSKYPTYRDTTPRRSLEI